jgi:membrane-bound inhibitor of C-type lysozyme
MRSLPVLSLLLLALGGAAGCTPPQGPAPSRTVRYVCGAFTFSVLYEEAAAVLVMGARLIPLQPGEDGRWSDGSFTFWERHGRAHLLTPDVAYRDCLRKI